MFQLAHKMFRDYQAMDSIDALPDKKGRIWLGTASGVTCYDPSSDSFKPFGWESLMPDTMCFSLCELHDGSILVGTDHGLYRYNNAGKRMEHFPGSEVLNDKIISYIQTMPMA